MTTIISRLDKKIEEGEDTVDDEMFFKAIEGTIPPHIAPLVMSHIKKNVNEFKGEALYELLEELPSEIYQDSFNKKEFNEEKKEKK